MTKTITKIGNSQGLMFDAALLDITRLKVGDQVTVTVHEGGSIVLTPVRPVIDPKRAAATARRLIRKNAELFRRLSCGLPGSVERGRRARYQVARRPASHAWAS